MMKLTRGTLVLIIMMGALVGCASHKKTIHSPVVKMTTPAEQWQNLSKGNTLINLPDSDGVSVVFLRPNSVVNGPAVNIYIDGQYLTSLLPGAYKQAMLCDIEHKFTINHTQSSGKPASKPITGTYRLQEGHVKYYLVVEDGKGNVELKPASEAHAQSFIENMHQQLGPISRVQESETCHVTPMMMKKYI